jgi:hypothetical protein
MPLGDKSPSFNSIAQGTHRKSEINYLVSLLKKGDDALFFKLTQLLQRI